MYFLWKQTPHGTIRVSHEGLSDFVRRLVFPRVLSGTRICSLALAAGERAHPCAAVGTSASCASAAGVEETDDAQVTVVLFSRSPENNLEKRLCPLMEPVGMRPFVIWADRGGSEWADMRRALCRNPWAWMALAASIALVVTAGWAGFFWTAFWGTAAWFTVRGLSFLRTWMGDNLG